MLARYVISAFRRTLGRPAEAGHGACPVPCRFAALALTWLAMIVTTGAVQAGSSGQNTSNAPTAGQSGFNTSVAGTYPARQAVFQKYCLTCHNQNLKDRGTVPVAFDKLDLSNVGPDAQTWEKVVRKLRTGLMPPAGRPRPDKVTHDAFVGSIEQELDRAAATHPNPGRTEPFHRLNRAEYQNVIRDLLHLDVNVSSLLPPDDGSYGFDNIAG